MAYYKLRDRAQKHSDGYKSGMRWGGGFSTSPFLPSSSLPYLFSKYVATFNLFITMSQSSCNICSYESFDSYNATLWVGLRSSIPLFGMFPDADDAYRPSKTPGSAGSLRCQVRWGDRRYVPLRTQFRLVAESVVC